MCPHTVAYSNTFLLDIYGKEYRQAKRFETKTKKGAKPKINRTGTGTGSFICIKSLN